MTLFDVAPYETGNKIRRSQPRDGTPPPALVSVRVDDRWRAVSSKQHGVVHAVHHVNGKGQVILGGAALISWCGRAVVPMSFDRGALVNGCGACIEAGART